MDSCGVHVILDAAVRISADRRRLVLVRGPAHVDRVLELTSASQNLEIVDLDPVEPPVQALIQLAQGERAASRAGSALGATPRRRTGRRP